MDVVCGGTSKNDSFQGAMRQALSDWLVDRMLRALTLRGFTVYHSHLIKCTIKRPERGPKGIHYTGENICRYPGI